MGIKLTLLNRTSYKHVHYTMFLVQTELKIKRSLDAKILKASKHGINTQMCHSFLLSRSRAAHMNKNPVNVFKHLSPVG